ncbi:CCA tRNA nucleotidyltransferase [Nitratireductor kimnyeongensis]|uniref:CCA tRNA nucleotidyltransferase n=1 Tax=Nitratireductor kimnyeongensis TaxID=430679 RepID=A0ABW0T9X8_9HYPH|nr:CCA tRNA nucleotidyltransferase [Nitratireductor kimnyeongensis]QZZ36110.1 CCA tRNA nucleotidyltransferase [Nitratireductor kimnyeongensis]
MDKRLISDSEWLSDDRLQALLAALSMDGDEARVVGGAVRNTLLGQPVTDIDIATTTEPDETVRRARGAGFRTAPTGIDHGTVTVIAEGKAYEVTTLRADVETDGRHANVTFGRDWRSDAGRRDFTINALYARANGEIVDMVGGLQDLESQTLRFIGDADIRINEDYLRILRFFRFFAWYGRGRPDAAGLKACARHRDGLERLSAERVWAELKKLFSAPDPSRALLWMRQTGVLTKILPESEKWGIDTIAPLIETEQTLGWRPDPLLRLAAIIPPHEPRISELGKRLRLSNAEKKDLAGWVGAPVPPADLGESGFRKLAYNAEANGLWWRLKLALVSARARASDDDKALMEAAGYTRLIKLAQAWQKPTFPINGTDLAKLGLEKGKAVGEVLSRLEEDWVASDFSLKRDALLERAASIISSAG